MRSLNNTQGNDICAMKQIVKDKSIGKKWLRRIANRVDRCWHTNALKGVMCWDLHPSKL